MCDTADRGLATAQKTSATRFESSTSKESE